MHLLLLNGYPPSLSNLVRVSSQGCRWRVPTRPLTAARWHTGVWWWPSPGCGSAAPWRWCGCSHKWKPRCSTPPTRHPPRLSQWGRPLRAPPAAARRPQMLLCCPAALWTKRITWTHLLSVKTLKIYLEIFVSSSYYLLKSVLDIIVLRGQPGLQRPFTNFNFNQKGIILKERQVCDSKWHTCEINNFRYLLHLTSKYFSICLVFPRLTDSGFCSCWRHGREKKTPTPPARDPVFGSQENFDLCHTKRGRVQTAEWGTSAERAVETRLKRAKTFPLKASKLTDSRQTLEQRQRGCRTSTRERLETVLRKTSRAVAAGYRARHRSSISMETQYSAALPVTPLQIKGHYV